MGSELGGSVDSGYWARLVAGAGDSSLQEGRTHRSMTRAYDTLS